MKKLVSMVSMLAAGALFAIPVPDVDCITFSTAGTDTYDDGVTTVLDGECYALVWSADGVFEGIKADATPVDANDKVVYIGALAKGGKCQTVVFQIADGFVDGGQFDVFLLDTRRYAADGTVSVGKKADGTYAVSKAVKAISNVVVAKKGEGVVVESKNDAGVEAGVATALPEGVGEPKVKSIGFNGDFVVVEV